MATEVAHQLTVELYYSLLSVRVHMFKLAVKELKYTCEVANDVISGDIFKVYFRVVNIVYLTEYLFLKALGLEAEIAVQQGR